MRRLPETSAKSWWQRRRGYEENQLLYLRPVKQAFLRKGGVDKNDRLELSGMEFHNKVYGGYVELSKRYADRFIVIDASGEKEQTHQKIITALKQKGII